MRYAVTVGIVLCTTIMLQGCQNDNPQGPFADDPTATSHDPGFELIDQETGGVNEDPQLGFPGGGNP